jgi:hypothetical protein
MMLGWVRGVACDRAVSVARPCPCCRSPGVGRDGMEVWRICDDDEPAVWRGGREVQGYGDTGRVWLNGSK